MYTKMLQFVKDHLNNNEGEIPFRIRSEHTKRVFMWAERLVAGEPNINKEAVLLSAIFHDIGYAVSVNDSGHAQNSAILCEKYLKENNFDAELIDFVTYLVRNHSRKELMTMKDTPLELILLMEADMLDETGALSIVWDCMVEGAQKLQSFDKTFNHILNYSYKSHNVNPMVTNKAKKYWKDKQDLTKEFVNQLSFDLGIDI